MTITINITPLKFIARLIIATVLTTVCFDSAIYFFEWLMQIQTNFLGSTWDFIYFLTHINAHLRIEYLLCWLGAITITTLYILLWRIFFIIFYFLL